MQAWKLGPALAGGNTVVMKVMFSLKAWEEQPPTIAAAAAFQDGL